MLLPEDEVLVELKAKCPEPSLTYEHEKKLAEYLGKLSSCGHNFTRQEVDLIIKVLIVFFNIRIFFII